MAKKNILLQCSNLNRAATDDLHNQFIKPLCSRFISCRMSAGTKQSIHTLSLLV